jgi:hypothetical protein
MQVSSASIHKIAQYLNCHDEALRIRKLLFYICRKKWENNATILNSVRLEDFLRELTQNFATIADLQSHLLNVIHGLNRPKTYAEISQVIIEQLEQSLEEAELISSFLTHRKSPEISQDNSAIHLTEKIANEFANHPEAIRIKKLLLIAATNHWESNPKALEKYNFKNVITELIRLNPNKSLLERRFIEIVSKINKRNIYLETARIIVNKLEPIYDQQSWEEDSQEQLMTMALGSSPPVSTPPSASPRTSVNLAPQKAELATSIVDRNFGQNAIAASSTPASAPSPSPAPSAQPAYDPFKLRFEIVQATNPLRAKVLLFSVLYHPWNIREQDWSILKSYSLDDFIEQLIWSGRSLADIESKLHAVAHSLIDLEANMQTANTILKAIKPLLTAGANL